jgi:type II restriction enzyme
VTSNSYNRGEWAELYVLAKILCDQHIAVHVHGKNVSPTDQEKSKTLKVLSVSRGLSNDIENYVVEGDDILCQHSSTRISRAHICEQIIPFFKAIKSGRGISFGLEAGEVLLQTLGIKRLKRDTKSKSDIYVSVEDPLTGTTGQQGYTIKALIGSKPTLFNASEPTNFTYTIEPTLSQEDVARYNAPGPKGMPRLGPRKIVNDLISKGYSLTLTDLDERFKENLDLLDNEMHTIVSDLLLTYYAYEAGTDASVPGNVNRLVERNPHDKRNPETTYRKKFQDFLEAAAFGMVPTDKYDGTRSTAGGLLLVEKDGNLKCFRLDERDRSRDYLFEHTAFETASRKKHYFGVIESDEASTRLKLNLQIRYK